MMVIETSGNFVIKANGTDYNIEIVNHIDYEDLSFVVHSISKMNMDEFEVLGEGSYGLVYGYKGYAIKMLFEEDAHCKKYCNDIQALKDLSHLECVPNLYAVINDTVIITDRVNGVTIDEYCSGDYIGNPSLIDDLFVEKWDESLFEVILNGYSPNDLHENNVMIDFDKARPMLVDLGFFTKHNADYDISNIDSIKSNEGYSKANNWSGKVIREYASKYASI